MKAWQKKEKNDKKSFGGRKSRGSGNYWSEPADIKSENFLIECKYTKNKSFSISIEKWQKIYDEALFSHRLPLLSIQIKDVEVVVLSKSDFLNLIKKQAQ